MPKGMKTEHRCPETGCDHPAFSRRYELERHKKSRHHLQPAIGDKHFYRCAEPRCKSRKTWPRADNFRLHIKRVHPEADEEQLLRLSTLSVADLPDNQPHPIACIADLKTTLQNGGLVSPDPSTSPDNVEPDRQCACDWQDLSDSAVSLPNSVRKRRPPMGAKSSAASEQAIAPAGSQDGMASKDASTGCDFTKTCYRPIAIAHPSPVRAGSANLSDWHQELEQRTCDCEVRLPSACSPHTSEADKIAKEALKPLSATEAAFRTHSGRGGNRNGQASQSFFNNSGFSQQPPYQGSGGQGNVPSFTGADDFDLELAGGDPETQPPTRGDTRRFPCVFHNRVGQAEPTSDCSTRQRYVSKLEKHHAAQGHPGGPFLYCTNCFRHNFASEEEVRIHKREKRCNFLCVTRGCHNYNQEPSKETPCSNSHAYRNSQTSIWEKLYRIAHHLGPYDAVPDVPRRSTVSQPTHHPRLTLRVETPTPPQGDAGLLSTSTPLSNRSISAMSRSTSLTTPQHQPWGIVSMRGITPVSSPTYSSLGRSDQQTHATSFEQSLEGLARTMWRQVNQPVPAWSLVSFGWHRSAIMQGLARATSSDRITMLQTLIEAYQVIIDNPTRLTNQDWSEVRDLTQVTLPTNDIPGDCPWAQVGPTGLSFPSILSRPRPEQSSFGSSISPSSSFQTRSIQNTPSIPSGSRLASPFNPHLLEDYLSQTDNSTCTIYDRVQASSRNSYRGQNFALVPTTPSGPSDQAYVSGSASEYNSQEKGMGRSDFGSNQSHRSY